MPHLRPSRRPSRTSRGMTAGSTAWQIGGMTPIAPLAGVRIIEASMLGPAAITTNLVDLGADVIKVEPPGGDYGRQMTWPIVEETSLLFLHANRGKRSIVLDLRTDEGVEAFKELVADADCVVEAMRPGALARPGGALAALRPAGSALPDSPPGRDPAPLAGPQSTG